MAEKAILFDSTRCIACRACQVACKQWWELPGEETINKGTYENPTILTAKTWNRILFNEIEEANGVRWIFTRRACMHCTNAVCVLVCPSYARQYNDMGCVTIDLERCIGCGRCVEYCPFRLPKLGEDNVSPRVAIQLGTPRLVAYKCKFCEDRVEEGKSPACTKACPTGALQFGDREDMAKIGRDKVAAIKATYPKARLYGDTDLGGLHVLSILTVNPDVVGFPVDPKMGTYPEFNENTFPDWYVQAIAEGKIPVFPASAHREWYLQPDLVPKSAQGETGWLAAAANPLPNWTKVALGGWLGVGAIGAGAALLWTLKRKTALNEKEKKG
jgi:formate dehydrogenase iron-sulfur subunit